MNSRDINELHPRVARRCRDLIELCKAEGINIIVTSTYRSNEHQAMLYAQGRTAPGKRVTNARPGSSFHNYRLAFDVVPVVGGKAVWDDNKAWKRIGEIGKSLGLTWGGDFRTIKDKPHFEFSEGLRISDLRAGKMIKDED